MCDNDYDRLDSVLNGRIYRAAFLPLLFALAIAGFSLTDRPTPLGSTLAPDAFEGASAFNELRELAARFPDRRPGSRGDRELAAYIANVLSGLGGTAKGGFSVQTSSSKAQTIEGERTLETVTAQRPGATGEPPIVIIAHRDAAGVGAQAELSATAALLELARVFAASETQRTIILVSTSGGSGGNAGAAEFAARAAGRPGGQIDAALVLGNLAGSLSPRPSLVAFSNAPGSAAELLQRTVAQAISQQVGMQPETSTLLSQLAQLTFPLTAGEQGPLNARGQPAVLIQAGGELPPAANEPVSAARLEGFGRAVLSAVYALDAGPEVAAGSSSGAMLPIERKLMPEWALRLIVAALLLPPLLVTGDELARRRRRRRSTQLLLALPDGERSLPRWMLWTAACGLPFLVCALFASMLGHIGAIAAPYPPVAPAGLPAGAAALEAVLAVLFVLVLAWLAWPALMRRLALPTRPAAGASGLAVMLVLCVLTLVVWANDPFTALLLVPALHLWLVFAAPERPVAARTARGWVTLWPLAPVALALVPLGLLIAFYAHRFGLGLGGVAQTTVLLFAGGRIGLAGMMLWSLAAGCAVATLLVALAPVERSQPLSGEYAEDLSERELAPIRGGWVGPNSHYAGPGSLGGTDSALRR